MTTGERIRNYREDLDMLQQELADATKINVSVLNRIEKGTRAIRDDELRKIADKLNISSDYLIGRTDDPTPPASGSQRDDGTGSLSALSAREQAHISKYRVLSDASKDAIDNQTDYFYQREQSLEESSQTGNAS